MLLRENPYFAILCVTTVVSGCVAFVAWIRREEAPATRPFTLLMGAIALHAAAGAIGTASVARSAIVFWATVEVVLFSAVTALFFTFSLHFTDRGQWIARRRWKIWLIPCFNIGLAMSNRWHHWLWTDFVPVTDSHVLDFQNGPVHFWLAAWSYIYMITGTLLVVRKALRVEKIYRRQAAMVVLGAIAPAVAGSLYLVDIVPPGINLLPMSFLFTGIVYVFSLLRFRLFDVLPIARDKLIENMSDSVLVLDGDDRVIDMNPAAWIFTQRIAPVKEQSDARPTPYLGQPVNQVFQGCPSLLKYCKADCSTEVLINICQHPPLHIALQLTILSDTKALKALLQTRRHQKPSGKLLVIRDVTDVYETQAALKQTNITQHQTQKVLSRTNKILLDRLLKIEALQTQLKEQATRDSLTNLFNRRYFDEALFSEFTKARRSHTPLSVLLVDLDNFKSINDTYGHQAGDHVLQTFASIMRQQVRISDIASRYGGEEFILAMPGMTFAKALQRAEKLRTIIKETKIEYKGSLIQVTISGGVGALPEWCGNQEGLISAVDKALYAAKTGGRDRICSIGPFAEVQPAG